MLNYRTIEKLLAGMVLSGADLQVRQERPYSFAQLQNEINGEKLLSVGFSKVSWPDVWDGETGIEIAVQRAARQAVHQLLRRKPHRPLQVITSRWDAAWQTARSAHNVMFLDEEDGTLSYNGRKICRLVRQSSKELDMPTWTAQRLQET